VAIIDIDRPSSRDPMGPLLVAGWLAIVVLFLVLTLRGYDAFQVGAWQDDAAYVLLARSLADGLDYGYPSGTTIARPARFPFGLPLLLAPLVRLFPGELVALRSIATLATLINLTLLFWAWPALGVGGSRRWSLGVCAIYGLSPLTGQLARTVLTEPPFLTLCLVGAILAERTVRGWRTSAGVATGLAALGVVALRSIGAAFVVAIVLRWLLADPRRGARLASIAALGAAAGLLGIAALTPVSASTVLPVEYWSQLTDPASWGHTRAAGLDSRIARSATTYGGALVGTLLSGTDREIVSWLLTAFVLVGLWRARALVVRSTLWSFLAIYALVLLIWPWTELRFLAPVHPLLALAVIGGIEAVASASGRLLRISTPLHRAVARASMVGGVVVLAAVGLVRSIDVEDSREHLGDLRDRTSWIRQATPPQAVVLSEYATIDGLYGERAAQPYPRTAPYDETALRASGADLVLIGPELRWQPLHDPVLSWRGRAMRELVERMRAAGDAALLHADPAAGVWVYELSDRVRSEAHPPTAATVAP
jgi:hypothetical protein